MLKFSEVGQAYVPGGEAGASQTVDSGSQQQAAMGRASAHSTDYAAG
jgi:hypothetical protein